MADVSPPDTGNALETVISADGTEIAYGRTGTGPPVVLVHGSGVSDHRRWDMADVRQTLAKQVTVYAMDRRGRGESGDTAPYSLEKEMQDVVAVVESIGEPVVLLGHSYGANIALEVSLITPSLQGFILYEPGIAVDDHQMSDTAAVSRMNGLLSAGKNEAALMVFCRDIAGLSFEEIDAFRADPSWEDRVAGAHTLPREEAAIGEHELRPARFAEMTTPTLLLSGGESPQKFRDATKAVHEALPNSRIVSFEGQQHVAMTTAPTRFVDEVLAFVRETR